MSSDQYLDRAVLKAALQSDGVTLPNDDAYNLAIDSASRWIDGRCSDPDNNIIRHFWQEETPSTRYYHANDRRLVRVGDFEDPDDLLVEVDLVGNGTWTPMAATDWQPEPLNRLKGEPYTQIVVATYEAVFPLGLRPRVRGTAPWGYAAYPSPVVQATKILAVAFMLGIDVISNEDGYSVGSVGPTNPIALAESLIERYMPDTVDTTAFAAAMASKAGR